MRFSPEHIKSVLARVMGRLSDLLRFGYLAFPIKQARCKVKFALSVIQLFRTQSPREKEVAEKDVPRSLHNPSLEPT